MPENRRVVDGGLVLIALLIACGYLALGVGNVMDDWYTLNHARFDGAWRAAGADQIQARPVASLVYAAVFGLFGRTLVPTILFMALANAASAVLIRRLAAIVAPRRLADATAILWLVLPTTTSLEAWASAANISLALVLGLGAVWIAARSETGPGRIVVCVVLSAAAVLAYEVVLVLIGVVSLALLVLDRRRSTTLCIATLGGAAAGFVWMVTHWHPNKRLTSMWGDVGQVVPGNFTWGIAPRPIGLVIGAVVLVVSGIALSGIVESESWKRVRAPIALGWALVVVGVIPFLKYTYSPIGAGDRANTVSSIGGALVLASVVWVLANGRPRAATVGVVLLVAVSLQPRVLMMRSWALAGQDADRIIAAVERDAVGADRVVLGPAIVARNGATAMQHPDIFEDAVQWALDDPAVVGAFPDDPNDPNDFPSGRGVPIDVRTVIPDRDAPGRR